MNRPLLILLACALAIQAGAPDFSKKKFDWRTPVPYFFDDAINSTQREAVKVALQTFTDNTCLDFTEDTGEGTQKLQYLLLTDNTQNCNAVIGDLNVDINYPIELKAGCFNTNGIQHETMHALGFRHTHVRHDRDKYVEVAASVLDKSSYRKLEVLPETTDYGIPYEFNSILHYATSANLKAIDPDYSRTLGGTRMLFNDWKLINMHYKCVENCSDKITCQNGGYQHPRQCSQCVCPRFYKGSQCDEEIDVVTLGAGESKQLDYGWTMNNELYNNATLFQMVELYPKSPARIIKAPEGSRIRVDIVNISDAEYYVPTFCGTKALEIVDGGDLTRVGKKFCHKSSNGRSFVSETNVLGYQVTARPGLNFVANVTFTVVP